MAETRKHDLRDRAGEPGVTPGNVDAQFIGKEGTTILPDAGQSEVKPLPGDKGGMALGQVTKSN